jgi:hypothetical protein
MAFKFSGHAVDLFNVFDVLDASIPRCPCGQKVIFDA